ncbi:hypothetical protein J4Q44_G00100100 [Coregonus suidteri]|uniref:Uncharacterized protein n=1 Tax=Coregonus suidteri TaxID=861788 RepID=A0AAN8QWS5_9TELE
MSKLQVLNAFLTQKLTEAAVEIFGAVEKTITEYEEEMSRSNEERKRLQRLLDSVYKPEIMLHKTDPQQLTLPVPEEVPPEQQHCEQEWTPGLGQEDSDPTQIKEEQEDPEPTPIKKEQEELRTRQEEEQLQGLESDIKEIIFTPSCVKSDCDQDPPQPSHLSQTLTMQTRARDLVCISTTTEMETEPDGKLLNEFLSQRLTAATIEIFGAVEKTITEYQEEISSSKEEIERLQRLLDVALKPDIKLHKADAQQLTLPVPEDVPTEKQHCEQEGSPSLDQEEPEPTHIEEEVRTSQEEQQHQGLESDIEFIFTPPCVESDYDQDPPQPSLTTNTTEEMETEPEGEKNGASLTTSDFQSPSVANPGSPAAQNNTSGSVDVVASGGLLSALGLVRTTGTSEDDWVE